MAIESTNTMLAEPFHACFVKILTLDCRLHLPPIGGRKFQAIQIRHAEYGRSVALMRRTENVHDECLFSEFGGRMRQHAPTTSTLQHVARHDCSFCGLERRSTPPPPTIRVPKIIAT